MSTKPGSIQKIVDVATVRIVIVNWNTGALVGKCIESIPIGAQALLPELEIVLVDNGSTDDSLECLDTAANSKLTIIRNETNVGFAVACNQGAANASSDYLLFLNPDTQLLAGSLDRAVEFMESPENADVAICGIQLTNLDGEVTCSCGRTPTMPMLFARTLGLDRILGARWVNYTMVDWNHRTSRSVEHVSGAFYLIRTQIFRSLGGFDQRFFVYFEDIDLSRRTRSAGWTIYFLASSRAYHVGGGSSSTAIGRRIFYNARSRILFAFKHYGRLGGTLIMFASLVGEPVARLLASITSGSQPKLSELLWAFVDLWRSIPSILSTAASTQR